MPHVHPSGFPPRALDCANDGEGQALALREGAAFFFIVARGPSDATRACERVSPARVGLRERWRGTGPRPTVKAEGSGPGEGQALALRCEGTIWARRGTSPRPTDRRGDWGYHATQPPSTAMVCPVTQFAASDARNKTAPTTSSTSPTRPIGIRRTTSS